MEQKHFGFVDKISVKTDSDKILTRDFLNMETNRRNANIESSEDENTELLNNKTESLNSNENLQSKQKRIVDQNSVRRNESLNINNDHDYQSFDSESESKNEDNSDDNTSIDMPMVRLPDPNIDDNLPKTVTLLRSPDGGKCYIVGTAHFSIESQNDVSKIIQAVQPHVIIVELCVDRIQVLELDEETILRESRDLNFDKIMNTIRQNGMYKGLFFVLLLNLSAHYTKVLGLAPGGEFRKALMEAKKIPNCIIRMGDRPIKITFARALYFLTWWQKIKLAWQLLTEKECISQKDIEMYKSRDSVEEIMAELAGAYPALGEVFVKERDIYLTHSLQIACKPKIGRTGELVPARVVGIVGIGHMQGIIENWGKVKRSQIPPIMSVPPPSICSRVIKFTIKSSIIGTILYGGYKFIPFSLSVMLSLKSSVEHLLKPMS